MPSRAVVICRRWWRGPGARERRAHLRAALADRERQRAAPRAQGEALNLMRAALADWQGLLRQETRPARTALQALLAGRLVFTPEEHDGVRR
jgi:hypothetical protein